MFHFPDRRPQVPEWLLTKLLPQLRPIGTVIRHDKLQTCQQRIHRSWTASDGYLLPFTICTMAAAEASHRSSLTLAEREEAIEERDEERANVPEPKVANNEVEVKWDGPDDPEDPHNWKLSKRVWITGLCAVITIKVTFASSIASTTVEAMIIEMGMSQEVTALLTSLFLVGFIFGRE